MNELDMKPGKTYVVGSKLMQICLDCHELVRIDKPIFGSLHFCLSDEERKAKWCRENRVAHTQQGRPK